MNLWEKYKAGKVLGLHKLLIDSNKWIDCLWKLFKPLCANLIAIVK